MHLRRLATKYLIPIAIIVLVAIFIIGIKFFVIKIGIDEVGVRTVVWGVKRGIVEKDYGPGWHRAIPNIDQWDVYDRTVQTMEFADTHYHLGHDEREELAVRTADDYDVRLDVVVKFQIKKDEAWKLRRDIGIGERYKMIVENETRDVARSVFGKMVESDLYNSYEKRKRALECESRLEERLMKRHINIIEVLILEMRFDQQLERKIKNIKLAELDELLNDSKALAAEQRGITQTIDADTESIAEKISGETGRRLETLEAETTRKIAKILSEAEKYAVKRRASADQYKQELNAKGELLVELSQAEGELLRREAIAGLGGNVIVALEAARNINLADTTLSTLDINLLDVNNMASLLGAPKKFGPDEIKKDIKFKEAAEVLFEEEHLKAARELFKGEGTLGILSIDDEHKKEKNGHKPEDKEQTHRKIKEQNAKEHKPLTRDKKHTLPENTKTDDSKHHKMPKLHLPEKYDVKP